MAERYQFRKRGDGSRENPRAREGTASALPLGRYMARALAPEVKRSLLHRFIMRWPLITGPRTLIPAPGSTVAFLYEVS
jgi:hypothetical protein